MVNGPFKQCLYLFAAVYRLADNVNHSAEGLLSDADGYRLARIIGDKTS